MVGKTCPERFERSGCRFAYPRPIGQLADAAGLHTLASKQAHSGCLLKDLSLYTVQDSKVLSAAIAGLLIAGIGYVDYATGPHLYMSAFYLLPLGLSAWTLGLAPALAVAVASVAVWMLANVANDNVDLINPAVATWNGGVQLMSYVVVAWTISRVRTLQLELEQRVQERTAKLSAAQRDVLEISEREQRRIGQDLHDGLCQHLAATAFTCQALKDELVEQHMPQAEEAQKVLSLVKEAVVLSRQSAKGLHPVEMGADGLMEALEEFASTTSRLFGVSCLFECDSPVLIPEQAIAGHLFRIAQEATRNAINHGGASHIQIVLGHAEEGVELQVEDDGIGISKSTPTKKGMGLTIMKQRASIIGASFEVGDRQAGGTVVRCLVPAFEFSRNQNREPEVSQSFSHR